MTDKMAPNIICEEPICEMLLSVQHPEIPTGD